MHYKIYYQSRLKCHRIHMANSVEMLHLHEFLKFIQCFQLFSSCKVDYLRCQKPVLLFNDNLKLVGRPRKPEICRKILIPSTKVQKYQWNLLLVQCQCSHLSNSPDCKLYPSRNIMTVYCRFEICLLKCPVSHKKTWKSCLVSILVHIFFKLSFYLLVS